MPVPEKTAPGPTPLELIALGLVARAGRNTLHRAIQFAGRQGRSLGSLFGEPRRILAERAAPGDDKAVAALHACGEEEQANAKAIVSLCRKAGIEIWTCAHPDYPSFLGDCLGTQAPLLLFYQGNEALLNAEGGGIVGTRRPTAEAAGWAKETAQFLAGEGYTLMSGGAAGIDLEAHEAALRADGTTVLILPEGLHTYHPPPAIRRGLANGQVMLLSEFLPSSAWQTHQAMTRNRTIAACSRFICVVEPRPSGGSMFTAEEALRQGKRVFYWGGACRDGALRDRRLAAPLARSGQLDRESLRSAAQQTGSVAPRQSDLFGA